MFHSGGRSAGLVWAIGIGSMLMGLLIALSAAYGGCGGSQRPVRSAVEDEDDSDEDLEVRGRRVRGVRVSGGLD